MIKQNKFSSSSSRERERWSRRSVCRIFGWNGTQESCFQWDVVPFSNSFRPLIFPRCIKQWWLRVRDGRTDGRTEREREREFVRGSPSRCVPMPHHHLPFSGRSCCFGPVTARVFPLVPGIERLDPRGRQARSIPGDRWQTFTSVDFHHILQARQQI